MAFSRRDLNLLLPALAITGSAQADDKLLGSKMYAFEDLPVKQNANNRSRAVLDGVTHKGCRIEVHHTELAPGQAPHAPHQHEREEMLVIREGTLEVTILGKSRTLGPGAIVLVGSGEMHGWRNVGTTPAHYVVMALGRD
jgi:quercetin dioxygenase-like cupin family protein